MQFTNDCFLNEGGLAKYAARRGERTYQMREAGRVQLIARERQRHCNSCGKRVQANHVHGISPAVHPKAKEAKSQVKSILAKERRKEDKKTVWFKESEDSSDIEVEIIPADIGLKHNEVEKDSAVAVNADDMELSDLSTQNTQDFDKKQEPVSDRQEQQDTKAS